MRPVMLIHASHRSENWPTLRPASSWLILLGLNSTQSPNCLKPVLQTCASQTNPQVGKLLLDSISLALWSTQPLLKQLDFATAAEKQP